MNPECITQLRSDAEDIWSRLRSAASTLDHNSDRNSLEFCNKAMAKLEEVMNLLDSISETCHPEDDHA